MSAALQASLTKLDQAVNKLESVVDNKTKALQTQKGGQKDLFGMMGSGRKSNDNGANMRLLAEKLESAIDKVEKILQEN